MAAAPTPVSDLTDSLPWTRSRVYEHSGITPRGTRAEFHVNGHMVRVYVPATLSMIAPLRIPRRARPGRPRRCTAHMVTPMLREWYAEGDEEELEYVAFTRAAQSALQLAAGRPEGVAGAASSSRPTCRRSRSRRSTAISDRAWSGCPGPLSFGAVAAIHVDGVGAEDDVARPRRTWSRRRWPATRTPSSPSTAPRITTGVVRRHRD